MIWRGEGEGRQYGRDLNRISLGYILWDAFNLTLEKHSREIVSLGISLGKSEIVRAVSHIYRQLGPVLSTKAPSGPINT